MDVRTFTVGTFQENAYVLRRDGADHAIMVDPGDEPERLLSAVQSLGVTLDAILITHTHFDHIGAVAPVARATGAPVYCPKLELAELADPAPWTPPGLGPAEGYEAEHALEGGERLTLAGLDIEVIFTPGHSRGHVSYVITGEQALFSGDVLFRGSIGRTDLPGGDMGTLMGSIAELTRRLDDQTTVHPGHMGLTTIGHERATNPFLADLVQK